MEVAATDAEGNPLALPEELGFHVIYLSASDAREDGGFGPEFDHLASGAILSTTI
ncbi:MAG TPA: hypothetical protein VFZ76_19410 [Anaerolineales bacterium]